MHSQKEYKLKIRKLEGEIENWEKKVLRLKQEKKLFRGELKHFRKRVKELTASRDSWKEKLKTKQVENKLLKAQLGRLGKAKWHQYDLSLVDLCISLRLYCGCSYQSICTILLVLSRCLKLTLSRRPCANTIQNWVSKVGLYELEVSESRFSTQPVALIVDESIRLGQEKLLLILGTPWEKQNSRALGFEEVEVLYMEGSKSWTGEKISKVIKKVVATQGLELKSILSDQDGKLKKAARLLGLSHLPDISHAVATCLRRTFEKRADYKAFTKLISSYQSRCVNQDLSYLSPPKQRAKARFMNQEGIVNWAKKLLDRFEKLNDKEQAFFKQLADHKPIITVLSDALSLARKIALPLKTEGLSTKTLRQARKILESSQSSNDNQGCLAVFLKHIETYLDHYQCFTDENPEISIPVSSEIIESMFGKYKTKAHSYALTGLTNPKFGITSLLLQPTEYCPQNTNCLRSNFHDPVKQLEKVTSQYVTSQ